MRTTKKWDRKEPAMRAIRELERGEMILFPLKMVFYLRSSCSTYGIMLGRKYRTRANYDDNCVEVWWDETRDRTIKEREMNDADKD